MNNNKKTEKFELIKDETFLFRRGDRTNEQMEIQGNRGNARQDEYANIILGVLAEKFPYEIIYRLTKINKVDRCQDLCIYNKKSKKSCVIEIQDCDPNIKTFKVKTSKLDRMKINTSENVKSFILHVHSGTPFLLDKDFIDSEISQGESWSGIWKPKEPKPVLFFKIVRLKAFKKFFNNEFHKVLEHLSG